MNVGDAKVKCNLFIFHSNVSKVFNLLLKTRVIVGVLHFQVFPGNRDRTNIVKNVLKNYVKARFVRFYINSYVGFPCLRVEILGLPISIIG